MTDPTSRYARTPVTRYTLPDGRDVACYSPRVVPLGRDLATLGTIEVTPLDRIDRLAARALGDPRLFWRLCDANDAIDPIPFAEAPGTVVVPEPEPGG